MNDSIIIGSVIVLVFGALSYYLYSRLLYSEKRVNVMENILLDLKTASETYFSSSETAPAESYYEAKAKTVESVEPLVQQQEEQSNDVFIPSVETLTNLEIESTPISTKIQLNYESMNLKELQQEGRNRNISGVGSMRRKEIIEHLRKSDDVVDSSSITLDSFVDNAAPITE